MASSALLTIEEYQNVLQRAEKVSEHYLKISSYSENDRYQRSRFLKELEKRFKDSEEKLSLMIETHWNRVKKKSKYCITLLTDQAVHCNINIWLVDFQSLPCRIVRWRRSHMIPKGKSITTSPGYISLSRMNVATQMIDCKSIRTTRQSLLFLQVVGEKSILWLACSCGKNHMRCFL